MFYRAGVLNFPTHYVSLDRVPIGAGFVLFHHQLAKCHGLLNLYVQAGINRHECFPPIIPLRLFRFLCAYLGSSHGKCRILQSLFNNAACYIIFLSSLSLRKRWQASCHLKVSRTREHNHQYFFASFVFTCTHSHCYMRPLILKSSTHSLYFTHSHAGTMVIYNARLSLC